jgi:hypothetical protein
VSQFAPGDRVTIRDARGAWHLATALSAVEGIKHPDTGRKWHDFPVVWIEIDNSAAGRMPWPVEDVLPYPHTPDPTPPDTHEEQP